MVLPRLCWLRPPVVILLVGALVCAAFLDSGCGRGEPDAVEVANGLNDEANRLEARANRLQGSIDRHWSRFVDAVNDRRAKAAVLEGRTLTRAMPAAVVAERKAYDLRMKITKLKLAKPYRDYQYWRAKAHYYSIKSYLVRTQMLSVIIKDPTGRDKDTITTWRRLNNEANELVDSHNQALERAESIRKNNPEAFEP